MEPDVRHGRDESGIFTTVRLSGAMPSSAWHSHASLVLGRVDRGRRVLRLVGTAFNLGPGDGFAIPPDIAHAWDAATDTAYRVLTVDPARARVPSWSASQIRDTAWTEVFDATHAAVETGDDDAQTHAATLLAVTDRLLPRRRDDRKLPGAVLRARRLTSQRLEYPLALAELGAQVGMSQWHLHRLYHRGWGLTPAQHRLEARLRAARALLLTGSSVAYAAAATGFADQSHLCRTFSRLMGVPPSVWLKQIAHRQTSR
jgi:AraC-like DNA-binding protein